MTSRATSKGWRSSQVKMEAGVKLEPAFIPLPFYGEDEYTAMCNDYPTEKQAKENIPFVEIRKEDIDMIEKAAKVLDARSKAFQPGIEYLAISDSPLSLVKNAKNAFETAMNSALQIDVKKAASECRVKARTRLQSKFSSDEGVKTFVTVNDNLGEAFNPDIKDCSVKGSSCEKYENLPSTQVQNSSLARPDITDFDLGCMPSAVTTPPCGVLQNRMHSYSSFVNDEPLDLTSPGKGAPPSRQSLSTSTIACDVLQAMVDCAADDLAKAKKPDDSIAEGKTIEIHLYSEPKSVIQHRNRCIKNSQVEQVKGRTKEGSKKGKDGSLTNIQWLGNMTSDTLVKGQQGRRMYITEKQIQKVQKQCGSTERPPYSYLHLIQMAINSKPDRRMTLREIYEWMETTFPYFKHSAKPGWKNSIRHNLSLYDIFVRETCVLDGEKKKKASFWTLKVPEVSEEDDAENVEAEEKTPEISMTAVRKYRSTPRAICPKGAICQPPLVYNDVVVGVPPSQQQPGHIPLLPKPSGDTYTLIPVQGMPPVHSTVHPILPACTLTSPNPIQTGEDSNSYQGMESSLFNNNTCMEMGRTEFTHLKRRHTSNNPPTTSSKQPRIFSPITPGFQYSSCEYDSGIDLRSMYEKSSCSDFSPLPVEETKQKRVRAPRKPRQPRKSKKPMKVLQNENQNVKQYCMEGKVLSCVESGMASTLEAGFTSPLRDMLNTPPRKDMLATSTPMRSNYLSPRWYSPVSFQTVTPVRNASLAPTTFDTLATPSIQNLADLSFGFPTSPQRNSPKDSKMRGRSLGLNIGDNSFTGMTGLTPLKPKDANISGLSVNDSLGRILGDIQFDDNLLDDGGIMPFVDVKDISWLNH